MPEEGLRVYLTDTLESPNAQPAVLPLFMQPIAEQHALAQKVKNDVPVIVCIGNPPYRRTDRATAANHAETGGWVRWGDEGDDTSPILDDFSKPAVAAGHGVQLHNLYNLYVYFWRWALWKVFECRGSSGPGAVSFISASSYLDGDAFAGMREHMRRLCDEVWVLDLGGEAQGVRSEENVFDIQTPVAIALAIRVGAERRTRPARVHYARIAGARAEKLTALAAVDDLSSLSWEDCPSAWQAPFRPSGSGPYAQWPLLTDLMPWHQCGMKAGRTWVVAADRDTLRRRWEALLAAPTASRPVLFKDSPSGRRASQAAKLPGRHRARLTPITELQAGEPAPPTEPVAYRFLDRQYVLHDARLIDRPSPGLWRVRGPEQVYLTTLPKSNIGPGPALVASAEVPDLHHFRGSFGGKGVFPLYRTARGDEANLAPGLTEALAARYGRAVSAADVLAYIYGVAAHPGFTEVLGSELATRQLRIPLTSQGELFEKARAVGARLLWLHTFGERFAATRRVAGSVPRGRAQCVVPIPGEPSRYPTTHRYDEETQTLHVGEGAVRPVGPRVYGYAVSGMPVVASWLAYRERDGAGKTSSELDGLRPERWTPEFTTELLQLLWIIEHTLAESPRQAALLREIVSGPLISAADLPKPDEAWRRGPDRPAPEPDLPEEG